MIYWVLQSKCKNMTWRLIGTVPKKQCIMWLLSIMVSKLKKMGGKDQPISTFTKEKADSAMQSVHWYAHWPRKIVRDTRLKRECNLNLQSAPAASRLVKSSFGGRHLDNPHLLPQTVSYVLFNMFMVQRFWCNCRICESVCDSKPSENPLFSSATFNMSGAVCRWVVWKDNCNEMVKLRWTTS